MQNRPPPDYKDIEQKAWRENVRTVVRQLQKNQPNIVKKVATYAWRFGCDEIDVREKIYTDEMFAAHFATDPTRQRLHERVAADWLQNTPSIENFELLPSSRKAGLYVTSDGEIRIGGENAPGKSLDFRWTVGEITYLASHKYTKESGGAQDQQFAEMLSLLRRFQNCQQKGYVLIVIVDGTYYTGRKMQALQNATRDHDPRSFASHIENVPDIINRLHNE